MAVWREVGGMHTHARTRMHARKFSAFRDPVGEAAEVCVGRGTGGEEEEETMVRTWLIPALVRQTTQKVGEYLDVSLQRSG